ncbi:hypothetical protein WAI453_009643 [Rhynchosporium graminicola]
MEDEKPVTSRHPIWVPIVHLAQIFFSVVVLGLSGWLIQGKYFDTLGYDIFTSLLTWLVVAYLLITTHMSSFAKFTHILLVIAANAVLVLFWLAAMGGTARLRSRFKYDVTVYGCYDDGSNIDYSTCLVGRKLEQRAAVATTTGLAVMSGIAGVSALVMLLSIAPLVNAVLTWKNSRSTATAGTSAQVQVLPQKQEQQGEGYQMAAQPQFASAPAQQQQLYAPPQHYAPSPQQTYPPPPQNQQIYTPPPQQAYPPPPQQFSSLPQGYELQNHQQQQQQYVQPQQQHMASSPQQGHSELYTQVN